MTTVAHDIPAWAYEELWPCPDEHCRGRIGHDGSGWWCGDDCDYPDQDAAHAAVVKRLRHREKAKKKVAAEPDPERTHVLLADDIFHHPDVLSVSPEAKLAFIAALLDPLALSGQRMPLVRAFERARQAGVSDVHASMVELERAGLVERQRWGLLIRDASRFVKDTFRNTPTDLYRCYAIDDTLLYVGIAFDVKVRHGAHRSDKWWWPFVARTESITYGTREAAKTAESRAIRDEHPVFNLAEVPAHLREGRLERRREWWVRSGRTYADWDAYVAEYRTVP